MSQCNNQGIVHLRIGPARGMFTALACKQRNAHMAVGTETFDAEPLRCKRCDAKWAKMKAAAQRRAAKGG